MRKPLTIGNVRLAHNVLLAPLAGFTDLAFRRLCREEGAALTPTEMVSVRGLCHGNVKTRELVKVSKNENPSCVQLFGSDPADFAFALTLPVLNDFSIVDINMGCPMPKITTNGDGSALLEQPLMACKIVEACAKTGRTVSVKVRLGVRDGVGAVAFCKGLEAAGAAAITVHGRTAKQLYTGHADWDKIGAVKAALKIPVIGNGDIWTAADIARVQADYGVDGVMVGRGSLGNPQIFSTQPVVCDKRAKAELMKRHLAYALEVFPERYVVTSLRKHFVWYLKGIAGVKELKAALVRASSAEEILSLLDSL